MTELRQISKQKLLRELQTRIQTNQINEDEIAQLLEKEI
jgi:hypothetical protein